MNNLSQRPALGQIASVGTLYDAKTEKFLPFSLLNEQPATGCISSVDLRRAHVQVSYVDSYEEKFDKMGMQPELQGSFLAGLVQPVGSGAYLCEKLESSRTLQAALHHTFTTVQDKLNYTSGELQNSLAQSTLRCSEVTHVVSEVVWGAQSIVMAKYRVVDRVKSLEVESRFRAEIDYFKAVVQGAGVDGPHIRHLKGAKELPVDITIYSDVANEALVMADFREACKFLELMPLQTKNDNGGRGKPILYSLLPVNMLSMLLPVRIIPDLMAESPSAECLQKFVKLFDEFRVCRQKVNDYQFFASRNQLFMPKDHLREITDCVRDMEVAEDNLKSNYAHVLRNVRDGSAKPDKLWNLLDEWTRGDMSPGKIATIAGDYREKVEFLQEMTAQGATYIGYNGLDLRTELLRQGSIDAYVFSFSDEARKDQESWRANESLLHELLNERPLRYFVAVVDCDATQFPLDRSVISHYRNGSEVSGDLLERRRFAADNCFASYDLQSLETEDVHKPVKRRFVKIACPGSQCDDSKICHWICSKCDASIEYGFSDQYIYCDCGRSLYSNYSFKCNSPSHGSSFDQYGPQRLLQLLNTLNQSDYLNVLILGETGVGKSTFINAFVNYINFETLEEAKNADKLHWVIPCAFSTQIMDRANPNSQIQEQKVQVGSRDDEHDGSKGASATQRTTVYPITIGTTTYRLIDTPGIGDTRGIRYDEQNMSDILLTLSSYDELHGVLILLKSNSSRMTAHFAFCVKELLMHLHRSAADNIVFGFTNTRISNYSPGDSFGSLKTLLGQLPNLGLSLATANMYCYDSESFRYLAAYKNGIYMDNGEDFRRSWKHSRDEAWRMIDHFKSKSPHPVRSTLSLNGTRELISQLTKPMADISQLIRTNMTMCQDEIAALKDVRLTGDQLRTRLNPKKKLLRTKPLSKPRTVCGEISCVEFKDDGTGTNTVIADYVSHCHAVCYLTNVQPDVTSYPGLIDCAAFGGKNNCSKCSHSWTLHRHILYEVEEYTTTVKDSKIEEQLRDHASDVELKQTAIRNREILVKEYQGEHDQIQEAAARFGIWLKDNSITPYNDATLAYLDVLMKDEEAKVMQGGNKQKLRNLEEDREKHKELVAVLERSMKNTGNAQKLDPAGVDRLVRKLYQLKHFGKTLEHVKQGVAAAYEGTYREMPYRVHNRGAAKNGTMHPGFASSHQPHDSVRLGNQSKPAPTHPGFWSGTMRTNSQQAQMSANMRNGFQQGPYPYDHIPGAMADDQATNMTSLMPSNMHPLPRPYVSASARSSKGFSLGSILSWK